MTVKEENAMQLDAVFFGKVQGVFLRHHIKQYADEMHLTGGVRNLADGSVALIAQGDVDVLHAFLERILQKPGKGFVDHFTKSFTKVEKRFKDFAIWL